MGALIRFVDARCQGSNRAYAFTLHAGEIRSMTLVSRTEKNAMIDCVIGEAACVSGAIEIVQGERRQKKAAVAGPLGERRYHNEPVPQIWQPVNAGRPGRVAWASSNGGLISNLRIWENVTLPLWYHARRDEEETERSVRHWLGVLGMAQDDLAEFMVAKPDGIDFWQRKLAGLLRALLQESPVLVVDAWLFDDVRSQLANSWIAALETYAAEGRTVLVMTDKPTTLPFAEIGPEIRTDIGAEIGTDAGENSR
jgi:ABC-type transporter Mla maintaining outer membrane lipid asymmetry ATPase subunit MlaF